MNRLLAASILIASSASAQVQLSGLRSGYVVDEATRVLRPIVGLPGSAYLGRAIPLPFPAASAIAIAGGGSLVVISAGDEPEAWLVRKLDEFEPEAIRLANSDRVFAGIRANTALLRSAREGSVRLVSMLDKAPSIGPEVREASLGGTLVAGAIDEESGCAYLAVRLEETSIVSLCPDRPGEPRVVRQLGPVDVTAMVYWKRNGLLFAERKANRVSILRAPAGTGAQSIVASVADGLADPAAMQPVPGARIAIVQGDPARLMIADPARKEPPIFADLPVAGELLDYLAPDRILSVNRVNASPLVVLDAEQEFASYFVPPAGDPE